MNWIRPLLPPYEVVLTIAPPPDDKVQVDTETSEGARSPLVERYWSRAYSPTSAVLRAIDKYIFWTHDAPHVLAFDVQLGNHTPSPGDVTAGGSVNYAVDEKVVEEFLYIRRTRRGYPVRNYIVFMTLPDWGRKNVVWMKVQATSATEAVWQTHESVVKSRAYRLIDVCAFNVFEAQHGSVRFARGVAHQRLPSVLLGKPHLVLNSNTETSKLTGEECRIVFDDSIFDPYGEIGAPTLSYLYGTLRGDVKDVSREVNMELLHNLAHQFSEWDSGVSPWC